MVKKKKKVVRKESVDFEKSYAMVESIVRKLEQGQLGLTESLSEYEQGVKHLKQCYRALEQAERKIELLTGVDRDGNAKTVPFSDESEDSLPAEFEDEADDEQNDGATLF